MMQNFDDSLLRGSLGRAARKMPTAFERVLQDADMPRCPLCRSPIQIDELVMCLEAHGMIALAHEACGKRAMTEPIAEEDTF